MAVFEGIFYIYIFTKNKYFHRLKRSLKWNLWWMISYISSIYAYDDNCRLCISIVLSFCLYSQLLSDQYRTDYKSLSSADTRAWSGPAVLVIVSSDDPSVHLFTCHIAYHHRLLPTTAFYSVNNNIWINLKAWRYHHVHIY